MQDRLLQSSQRVRETDGEADGRRNDGGTDFTIAEWISSSDQEATECAQTPQEKALLTAHIPPPQDNSSVLTLHTHSQGWGQALQHAHTHTAKEHTGNTNSEGRKEVSTAIALEGDCVHNLENERGTAHWTALKSSSPHSRVKGTYQGLDFFWKFWLPNSKSCVLFVLLSTKPLVYRLLK